MRAKTTATSKFIYITPAVLCCMAMLCGVIPCVLCLDGTVFAYISLGLFFISILIHIYIIARWRQYASHSPIGYAIVQPCNHFIIMCIALAVGATSVCNVPVKANEHINFKSYNLELKK